MLLLIMRLDSVVLVELFIFTDEAMNMLPASVDHIQEMVSEHVFRCILMILQGLILNIQDIGMNQAI